jgi:hypothetical protein
MKDHDEVFGFWFLIKRCCAADDDGDDGDDVVFVRVIVLCVKN